MDVATDLKNGGVCVTKSATVPKGWLEQAADKAKAMVEGAVTKGKEAVEKGKVEAGKVANGAAMKVSELVSSHNEGVFNDKKVTKAS